jgi:hypothetical protein
MANHLSQESDPLYTQPTDVNSANASDEVFPSPEQDLFGSDFSSVLPDDAGDAGCRQSESLALYSDEDAAGEHGSESEEDHEEAIKAWLERACLPTTGVQYASAELEEASAGEPSPAEETEEPVEPEQPDDPDEYAPRTVAKETVDSIKAMRDLAITNARQAVGRYSCQQLIESARLKLWFSAIALLASVVLQMLSGGASLTTLALAFLALICAARWALQYLSVTNKVSTEYASACGAQQN